MVNVNSSLREQVRTLYVKLSKRVHAEEKCAPGPGHIYGMLRDDVPGLLQGLKLDEPWKDVPNNPFFDANGQFQGSESTHWSRVIFKA